MGFSRLVLVKPRFGDVLKQEEAIAFASGAQDILENALIVETLEEALENCHFDKILTDEHVNCALVFGSERYGLSNEDVEQCHALISIPANPDYSSLNLAQAIQILAYECRMAILDKENLPTRDEHIGFHGEPASVDQINGMFAHLETALTTIGFLNPDNPKKLMPRLRRLFSRSSLETEEVNILRGIARQIEKQATGKK